MQHSQHVPEQVHHYSSLPAHAMTPSSIICNHVIVRAIHAYSLFLTGPVVIPRMPWQLGHSLILVNSH